MTLIKLYKISLFCALFLNAQAAFTQNYTLHGNVKDATTAAAVSDVLVTLKDSRYTTQTNLNGSFTLTGDFSAGTQLLVLEKTGYKTLVLPISLEGGKELNLYYIPLETDLQEVNQDLARISLSDTQLSADDEQQDNVVSGLLGATNDVFSNAAAFDFSATFFRPRGLDSKYSKVLINGIELNKLNTGRPQWGNWGGLNDVMRNREFSLGIQPSEYSFGAPAGVLHFNMHASQYRRGGRVSYAYADRTYTGRVMASYSSGLSNSGWAYTFLTSRRFGSEGAIEGTPYDANSFFVSIEKKLNEHHSINLIAFYTPNTRGRSTALTQEAADLKGFEYNPNWGYQDGKIRNSRMREIKEPVLILTHNWLFNEKTSLSTNLAYQWGTTKNSRIDYTGSTLLTSGDGQESFIGGARNPAPNYYQNLPSYFLRFPTPTAVNYQNAYLAEQAFRADGQLDWSQLYTANSIASKTGLNSIYALQNEVTHDVFIQASIVLSSDFSEHFKLTSSVSVSKLESDNYAEIADLLGGNRWLDIDNFADDDATTGGDLAQSDLKNRNRIVGEGDRYKYDYSISALKTSAFVQLQATYNHIDFYTALQAGTTGYQREGFYENGYYPGDASLGKSPEVNFTTYGLKGGLTYKISGKHFLLLNAGLQALELPSNTVFINSRQNNAVVENPSAENLLNLDAAYIFRSSRFKAKLAAYYLQFTNGSELSFFYTNSLQSPLIEQGNALVQEVSTGISKLNTGLELGIEFKILPTLTFKTAAAVGENTYTNDPRVYYATTLAKETITFGDGSVKLKKYHVAGGPERAVQVGFDYRDPDFWWLGASVNHFSNAYIDVSNLRRSGAFTADYDGLPFNDFDPVTAKQLLRQEQIDPYYLVNIVGGKSWLVKSKTIGFFATLNNVLNTKYKTGGFEDSRVGDYRSLLQEKEREQPLFGNRYFLGYGATVYANVYVRF